MGDTIKLDLRIAQDSTYQGDDWWQWSIWIEGRDSDLNLIDHVVYQLHPTFPDPIRRVDNRKTKFALHTVGWGVFPIYARVVTRDGHTMKLRHDLVLRYEDGRKTTA